jgi:hypothetical protein
MRILVALFITSFIISLVALAYFFGQKSVEVSIASLTAKSANCSNINDKSDSSTLSFPLIKESKASTLNTIDSVPVTDLASVKESIDTTVIHAIRMGTWSEQDNRVFLSYISHLNKKERISVLKQMNKAINYQQMKIGSYIPNF